MNHIFLRALPLDGKIIFYYEKFIFSKVGVATYFCLFFKKENKIKNKTLVWLLLKENHVYKDWVQIQGLDSNIRKIPQG